MSHWGALAGEACALATDSQTSPFCLSAGSCFLRRQPAAQEVLLPDTYLSRPRMKALKRMVWLVSSGNWLTLL